MQIPSTVAELYARPNTWTAGAMCRDRCGLPVGSPPGDVDPQEVECCCLMAAIELVYPPERLNEIEWKAQDWINKNYPEYFSTDIDIPWWNDAAGRTQAEVLRLAVECKI